MPGTRIRACDGIDLIIHEGEFVGLVGESGCGKSTLGRTIVGLEKPSAGRVVFDGVDLATLRGAKLRSFRRAVLASRFEIDRVIASPCVTPR